MRAKKTIFCHGSKGPVKTSIENYWHDQIIVIYNIHDESIPQTTPSKKLGHLLLSVKLLKFKIIKGDFGS